MKRAKGNLLLLLTAFIWGSAFVAQSIGMDYIGPFTFSAVRDILAMLVLLPAVIAFGDKEKTWEKRLSPDRITVMGGLWCGVALGVSDAFQQVGIVYTTAGKAGFITALYIILVPLLGHFLGYKASRIIAFSVLLALGGFYLICIKEDFSLGLGDALIFGCAVGYALHILVIDYYLKCGANSIQMSWLQFFAAFLVAGTLTLAFEDIDPTAVWAGKLPLLYAGVLSSGLAYTLQIVGQKYTDAAVATLIMSLEAVFAALCGWAVLGEVMTVREIAGCGLVFTAVLLAQLPRK